MVQRFGACDGHAAARSLVGAAIGAGRGPSARARRQKAEKTRNGAPSLFTTSQGSRRSWPLKLRALGR